MKALLIALLCASLVSCGGSEDSPEPSVTKATSNYTTMDSNNHVVVATSPGVEVEVQDGQRVRFLIEGLHKQRVLVYCNHIEFDVWTQLANGNKFLLQRVEVPCVVGRTDIAIFTERFVSIPTNLPAGNYKFDLYVKATAYSLNHEPVAALGASKGLARWTVEPVTDTHVTPPSRETSL